MRISRLFFSLITLLLLIGSLTTASAQQQADSEYFPRKGHWVRGEFLRFYRSVKDPQRIFGEPITPAFEDPRRPGIELQYFERARMDYDRSKPEGQRIILANLGEYTREDHNPGQPADFSTNSNMCRTFSNGKQVCFAFLQFYNSYSGPDLFGQPISNTELQDGRLVQYFERARMEWKAEMPAGQRVVLTELGMIDFDRRIGNPDLKNPESVERPEVIEPRVYVFLSRSLLAAGQEQQVYVLVNNQFHKPITGVSVMITITYPDGHTETRRPVTPTNADGVTQDHFSVQGVQPNQVVTIQAEAVLSSDLKDTAVTWFRTWW